MAAQERCLFALSLWRGSVASFLLVLLCHAVRTLLECSLSVPSAFRRSSGEESGSCLTVMCLLCSWPVIERDISLCTHYRPCHSDRYRIAPTRNMTS
ncbi:hypothetical protein SRHO_G00133700 [Serrasalmus rhombeus]